MRFAWDPTRKTTNSQVGFPTLCSALPRPSAAAATPSAPTPRVGVSNNVVKRRLSAAGGVFFKK